MTYPWEGEWFDTLHLLKRQNQVGHRRLARRAPFTVVTAGDPPLWPPHGNQGTVSGCANRPRVKPVLHVVLDRSEDGCVTLEDFR